MSKVIDGDDNKISHHPSSSETRIEASFREGSRNYAYHCPFEVAVGDMVLVPTEFDPGGTPATVKQLFSQLHRSCSTCYPR